MRRQRVRYSERHGKRRQETQTITHSGGGEKAMGVKGVATAAAATAAAAAAAALTEWVNP